MVLDNGLKHQHHHCQKKWMRSLRSDQPAIFDEHLFLHGGIVKHGCLPFHLDLFLNDKNTTALNLS